MLQDVQQMSDFSQKSDICRWVVEIGDFVPRYSLEKRLAVYSILGGIPDYLQRWDDGADLMANISTRRTWSP